MAVMLDHTRVSAVILELEVTLKTAGLWEGAQPSASALASQEPFCVDTLSFSQWLQFVFIVRINTMIEQGGPLPQKSDIAPMAEESFGRGQIHAQPVIGVLRKFDYLISG